MMDSINPETKWALILPYLRQPVPAPLSSPSRSELAQTALTVCMRVSKLFESICEPLLYNTICSDALPGMLDHLDSPSMQRRLARAHTLYIEYAPKLEEPPYSVIMRIGKTAWRSVCLTDLEAESAILSRCDTECTLLGQFFMRVSEELQEKKSPIFGRLSSIAVSSVYGTDASRHHKRFNEWHQKRKSRETPPQYMTSIAFQHFLSSLPTLKTLCLRNPNGPMNIRGISWASKPEPLKINFDITQHFGADVEALYLPLGVPMKWVSDIPSSVDLQVYGPNIFRCIQLLTSVRVDSPQKSRLRDVADVQVWCSTAKLSEIPKGAPAGTAPSLSTVPQAAQDAFATTMAETATRMLRSTSGKLDVVRWYPSSATPICRCCGSGPPL